MMSPVFFAASVNWPAEVLVRLWNGVEREVRPPWSQARS
jgi:hypothetical protein